MRVTWGWCRGNGEQCRVPASSLLWCRHQQDFLAAESETIVIGQKWRPGGQWEIAAAQVWALGLSSTSNSSRWGEHSRGRSWEGAVGEAREPGMMSLWTGTGLQSQQLGGGGRGYRCVKSCALLWLYRKGNIPLKKMTFFFFKKKLHC